MATELLPVILEQYVESLTKFNRLAEETLGAVNFFFFLISAFNHFQIKEVLNYNGGGKV